MQSTLLSERMAVVARIKPQSVTAAATVQSDVIDMKNIRRVMVIANIGDYAAGNDGTLAFEVYGDTASGGSFATLITGKKLTPASWSNSTQDDAVGIIEISSDEVETQGLRYIRVKATPAAQNMIISAIVLGGDMRYGPASDYDIAAVKEIIN